LGLGTGAREREKRKRRGKREKKKGRKEGGRIISLTLNTLSTTFIHFIPSPPDDDNNAVHEAFELESRESSIIVGTSLSL
jgi:hypothetical protein